MALDKLTLLINRYKRIVDLNSDHSLDDKKDVIRNELIGELQNNPKGIIIQKINTFKFDTTNIENFNWILNILLENENNLSIPEIMEVEYHTDACYFENYGEEINYSVKITDLEGNEL